MEKKFYVQLKTFKGDIIESLPFKNRKAALNFVTAHFVDTDYKIVER